MKNYIVSSSFFPVLLLNTFLLFILNLSNFHAFLVLLFVLAVGWFKLLPTFGGCVITVSKAKMVGDGVIDLEVDYTTAKEVEGLSGLGK
jgi:hypothetical protein